MHLFSLVCGLCNQKCTSWHGTLQYSDDLLPWLRCRGMEVTNVLVDANQIMSHFIVTYNVPPALSSQHCFVQRPHMRHFINEPHARRTSHFRFLVYCLRSGLSRVTTSTWNISPSKGGRRRAGVFKIGACPHTHLHNKNMK